jgi:serine/threonine protein kinase/formylglycine-generating enzyme required for sulfatase activity
MPSADENSPDLPTKKLGEPGGAEPTDARREEFSVTGSSFSFEREPNTTLGRYRLERALGRGGFGVVYRAEDQALKRFVALKLLTRFQSVGEVDAWLEEARVLAGLDHPSIVPVYDVGKTDSGQPYIVSKLIQGGPLDHRIGDRSWTVADTVRVVTQLARALDYLHRRGVIHRDVKPSNILTTTDGNAVLADFGLALPESGYGRGARFVGTPSYMSPEQARHEGHRVDGRSDIYSLGVVFYELLTGKRPFQASDREQLLDCIRNVEVRPPRQLQADVPKELERICMKALAKKISDRYSTASDFAEDLEQWSMGEQGGVPTAPVRQVIEPPASPHSSVKSLELDQVAVIPHGLRPFDSNDADFFRYLLPGARDRFGVPESIRFWTHSILSRTADSTFRVGVLLGPSGSGKSSLIKAGVLPLVEKEVSIVYAEAKPEVLESNLASQLRRLNEDPSQGTDLLEQLTGIRQAGATRSGKKLLLVIDQFEQWLNHHDTSRSTMLRDALRQCDGVTVQAVLIVRDDFVIGISAFMDELDESMQQHKNFATVEPFSMAHARHVLAAFGRAYGSVATPSTAIQNAFIDEAVAGFSSMGRIDPLQIALLSEMTKGKPWSPATLKEFGGISGLGVAFLDEKLTGSSAHPLLRTHPLVVRRLLMELLPTDQATIKPPAMLESRLLERLEGVATEETLRRVLQLLDTEVRLLTPTSSMRAATGSQSGSSTSDPAYQLTHDYLVATTRNWLALQQTQTQAGRVREQLREIAATWAARPIPKRLPTLIEWGTIRWFTSPGSWTASERAMMRACDRRVLRGAAAWLIGSVLLVGTSVLGRQYANATSLAWRLKETDTAGVVAVLQEMHGGRGNWFSPLAMVASTDLDSNDVPPKEKLHAALATCRLSPASEAYVLQHLGELDDTHAKEILEYLHAVHVFDASSLAEKTRDALERRSPNALALASLLAMCEPDHTQWRAFAPGIVDLLATKTTIRLGDWVELLQPVRKDLVPALLEMGERKSKDGSASIEVLRDLIAVFAKEDPRALAQAATWVGGGNLEPLLRNAASIESTSAEMRALLAHLSDPHSEVRNAAIAPKLTQQAKEFGGMLAGKGGWLERVPIDALPGVLDVMQAAGYVPTSLRPYAAKQTTLFAVGWRRGTHEYRVAIDVTQRELETQFEQNLRDGWTMIDFASLSDSGEDATRERWFGVWHRAEQAPFGHQVLMLHLPSGQLNNKDWQASVADFDPVRFCVHVDDQGDLSHHILLAKSAQVMNEFQDEGQGDSAYWWTRIEYAAGDLYPGIQTADVRSLSIVATPDRGLAWQDYHRLLSDIQEDTLSRNRARNIANLASNLIACRQPERALEWLDKIDEEPLAKLPARERAQVQVAMERFRATAFAHLGRKEELGAIMEHVIEPGVAPEHEKLLLRLRHSVLIGDRDSAMRWLAELEATVVNRSSQERVLRGLALVASQDWDADASQSALERLIERADSWFPAVPGLRDTVLDQDFDALRSRSAWRAMLDRHRISHRISACGASRPDVETRVLFSESTAKHQQQAGEWLREGFTPETIHIDAALDGSPKISSTWVRSAHTVQEEAERSRAIASLALALGYFEQYDALLDGLQERWGRSVASELIRHVPRGLPASRLVSWFQNATSTVLQANLLAALGGIPWSDLDSTSRSYLESKLLELARSAPDARLANMARWCCRSWSVPVADLPADLPMHSGRNWFTNSMGQQLIRIEAPERVLKGKAGLRRMWFEVGRNVAISSTEVTADQFREFLEDPRVQAWMRVEPLQRRVSPNPEGMPQSKVSWEIAIRYCQWLNEREGIPEDQWCYENVWSLERNDHAKPVANYLDRTGYRLPTHVEWSLACSAGTSDPWHFGSDAQSASLYEWTLPHSQGVSHPIGRLRPNALGFFDMGGNLAEWNDDYYRPPNRPSDRNTLLDAGNPVVRSDATPEKNRILAGGRFRFSAQSATTDSMVVNDSNYISISTGFRIARTLE